ncbi:CobW family GTP-binding protein [Rhodopila sp.]|uniref:CobW family GTP-binding protein n=1 Tax=Rhodopila sp. TaxID=2480087 RepID=UPI003D12E87C
MAVPILLVTGFLGAGKTTLINHLLTHPQGRRLAAVVNDFGAIDIDAALLGNAADGVVSLKNGCICCSLQGDLLRTLSTILRRDPVPDGIVIETSGVSDPAEVVRALLDPVVWREAALDAVICVADAWHLTRRPDLLDDALCRSQIQAADFVALSKTDLVSPDEADRIKAALAAVKPSRMIFDMEHGRVPADILFSASLHQPARITAPRSAFATPDFETLSWTATSPLSLMRFQAVIGRVAGLLVRAKGILRFAERPDQPMLFQLVGERATLSPSPIDDPATEPVRLVLIARNGVLDVPKVRDMLADCVAKPQ